MGNRGRQTIEADKQSRPADNRGRWAIEAGRQSGPETVAFQQVNPDRLSANARPPNARPRL